MTPLKDTHRTEVAATSREALRQLNHALSVSSEPEGVEVRVEQSDEVIRLPREVFLYRLSTPRVGLLGV